MKKLKIFGVSNQDSGVGFYRINQPLRYIQKQGLAEVHTIPFFGQGNQHFVSPEFMEYFSLEAKWADVIFSTIGHDRYYLALLLGMRDYGKCKLVIDLDDDLLSAHLEPNSPAYYAYNDPSLKFTEMAQCCIKEADLLIVSTEYLKEKYKTLNKNIVVIKNAIDKEIFKHKIKNDGNVIGFAGSGSHQKDWEMVEPIIEKLRKKYDFKVKLLGPMHSKIKVDEQVTWQEMLKYPETLANMGITIGLAPIKDSLMNRAKSNLRWLEYSIYKIPTVASDVVPFRQDKEMIKVTEPEEWYSAIEKLLTDKKYSTKLALNSYNRVRRVYDPGKWSARLYNAIKRIV